MIRPGLFALLLVGVSQLSAQAPLLATGWRVFADPAERAAATLLPEEAGLLQADIERAGWTLLREHRVPPGTARLALDAEGFTVESAAATLVLLDADPGPALIRLDGQYALNLLDAGGGRRAFLVPPGNHRLEIVEIPVGRNAFEWWFSVLGAALIAALLAAAVHGLIGRGDGFRGAAPPGPRWGSWALLMLVTGLAWSWIVPLPYVALDYGLAHLAPAQIRGTVAGVPLTAESPYASIMGNSIFFRPAHHTVWGLEQAVFGASPQAMHAMSLVWHLINVSLVWLLLLRFVPRGAAFAGAALGGLWPVAGQALTWVITRQLPQSLTFGLLALLLALRYLRIGSVGSLMGVGASLWLTLATKESGVVHLAIVGLFAPLGSLPAWRWRRLLALASVLFALAGLYVAVRLGLGYGLSQGYGGLTFKTPLHMIRECLENLPDAFLSALALTNTDEAHGPPFWGLAVALALVGLFAGRRGLPLILSGVVISALCALPDAIWPREWFAPALARGCYVPALLTWGVLAAAATTTAWRTPLRPLRVFIIAVIVVACGVTLWGHWNERGLRSRMAEIAASWVEGAAAEAGAHDPRDPSRLGEGEAARGPAGVMVIGRPSDPELLRDCGPIIGPSLGPWIRPPFAARSFEGFHVASEAQARGAPFTASWPWEVMVLASPGGAAPPRYRETWPPITGARPRAASVRRVGPEDRATAIFRVDTGPGSRRGLSALALSFGVPVPAGSKVSLHGCRPGEDAVLTLVESTLALPRAAGIPLFVATETIQDWFGAQAVTDLELRVTTPKPLALRPELALRPHLGSVEVIAPAAKVEVAPGALLPPIRLRDTATCDAYRITLATSQQFQTAFPTRPFPVPAAAFRRVTTEDGPALEIDVLAHFGIPAPQWQTMIDAIASAFPNLDGFWLLLDVRGLVGNPPLEQSRSNLVPLKIRF